MKPYITEAMVDARVAEQLEAQAGRGVFLPIGLVRGLARTHLEMTAHSTPEPAPVSPRAPQPSKAAPRLLPAPVTAVPPSPVVMPVPAAVVADRARCQALIAMTAKGAEAEAECRAAIASATSREAYQATVAARSILDAIGGPKRFP